MSLQEIMLMKKEIKLSPILVLVAFDLNKNIKLFENKLVSKLFK